MEKSAPKKHSVRYDSIDFSAAVRSIYIMKAALPPIPPDRVVVKVEF